jgi:hypothetical protein
MTPSHSSGRPHVPDAPNPSCPFTLTEYRSLVRLAKDRFAIAGYDDYRELDSFVIWRHDVEYSVVEMSVLAEIDAEEGVRSTLFVQLHSELYNFWEPDTVERIRRWVSWGHVLGLHFDAGYHGPSAFAEIEPLLVSEKNLLEQIYETPITCFAYHNPNPESLSHREDYAGLVNAYNDEFLGGSIVYVSDSNGRWRERTVRDVLEAPETVKAQINTHDTWWTEERIPQIAKLERAIMRDAQRKIDNYHSYANVVVDDVT